jgi:hypothetical protein
MAKFKMKELIGTEPITARLGIGSCMSTPANVFTDKEIGKPVKMSGDSAYIACVQGDQIEGFIVGVETYTADDFSIGSVAASGRKRVMLDGLQATAGVGAIALGDYVVAGTVIAKDTALTLTQPPKVCKATTQTGMYFGWRVVSLEGTTAVGQFATIERVNA